MVEVTERFMKVIMRKALHHLYRSTPSCGHTSQHQTKREKKCMKVKRQMESDNEIWEKKFMKYFAFQLF